MPLVSEAELFGVVGAAREARLCWKAHSRTPMARDLPVRLRSQYRTHDRLGVRAYEAGDSVRLLVLRDLLNRNVLNVRTYLALAEVHVRVILDPSRALLAHAQTGPFAVKLAFGLAAAGMWARQPASVSFLGRRPATPPAARPQHLGGLARALAGLEPVATPTTEFPALLETDLGRPRANTNLFFLLHVGFPVEEMGMMLRSILGRVRQAVVFPIVAADEFEDGRGPILDPDTGREVTPPPRRAEHLAAHLDELVVLGREVGVPVEPLVVRDHRADVEALLPMLGSLT